jgi:HK97 gp10 family phage protein
MGMPKSVTKVKRNGVEFTSSVDKAKYTIAELIRAALRDSAKLIRRRILDKARKMRGMKKGKRIPNAFQFWLRKNEGDLQIGVKHDTWYGADQELGTNNQPARHLIRDTVYENIDQIRIIQGKYLEAIEDENRARGLIDEEEAIGDEDN